MPWTMELETQLWREASLATAIDVLLGRVGSRMLDVLDAELLAVRLVDRDHNLDTVAAIRRGAVGVTRPIKPRSELSAPASARIASWIQAGATEQARRELTRLREAAEADKSAALARLQMRDLGVAVVGADAGLREVMQQVEQVAPTPAPVLILGETGSGKEVVARAIHERSARRAGPLLRVNCGAIAPELIDSELFGHERGSFTGASAQHRGWFERA